MPSLWFNGDLTAGTGAPPAAPGSRLDGYVTSNDQMHINYVDADGHVHELWYQSPNGPWLHNDLTDISQGNPPSAAPGSALAGYETSANGQQHVNYLDANGHVHELVYKEPSWQAGDLTAGTGAPPAAPGSRLDGYVTSANGQMHINYLDANGHVHELVYKEPSWQAGDLTAGAGAPPAAPGSALAGYETSANGQQHVNYLDAEGHVHELVYKEPSWQAGDLTAGTGAPPAAPGSRLDGYVTSFNGQMHINYLDAEGHVHELVYKEPSWQAGDLTAGAGAPPAAPGSALAGYETSFNNQQHINYLDTDGHVHELWYQSPNGPWLHNDLTDIGQGNPPPAAPGSALAGYETSFNSQMHINYLDANGHVHELVYKHSPITVTPTSIIYNISVNLGADTGNIAGPVSLTLTSDGSYNFSGQLNNSGLLPYNVNVVVAIASDAGTLFLYTASQQIGANIPTVNNSWNWENTGNNGSIKAVWADLQAGIQYDNAESNTLALDTIWNSMQSTFQGIKQIIQIIGSL